MTEITILGTGSMVPTKERNVQAVLLEHEGELILFDCGEGTQRQMNIAGYSRAKVRKVFLTHWHGDHVSGLIGLIQTVFNSEVSHTLHVYGPKGTQERMRHLAQTVDFESKTDVEIHELAPQNDLLTAYENDDYRVQCVNVRHGTPTIAYRFEIKPKRRVAMDAAAKYGLKTGPLVGRLQRGETVEFKGKTITPEDVCYTKAGKSFVLIPDTGLTDTIHLIEEGADLVVSEATFTNEHEHKAAQFKHLTAAQAALMASQAGAERLVLTHFSQRYQHPQKHLEEARVHHENVEAAYDFMKLKL